MQAAIPFAEVLGRPARFTIELADPVTGSVGIVQRVLNGTLNAFDEIKSSADETSYEVILEPRLKEFDFDKKSRLFQNQNAPSIIESVLRNGGLTAVDFRFELRHEYSSREYTTQYNETSLAFIQRIAADEGIWFRFEQTDEREVVVFGDDLDAYSRVPLLAAPYREAVEIGKFTRKSSITRTTMTLLKRI